MLLYPFCTLMLCSSVLMVNLLATNMLQTAADEYISVKRKKTKELVIFISFPNI